MNPDAQHPTDQKSQLNPESPTLGYCSSSMSRDSQFNSQLIDEISDVLVSTIQAPIPNHSTPISKHHPSAMNHEKQFNSQFSDEISNTEIRNTNTQYSPSEIDDKNKPEQQVVQLVSEKTDASKTYKVNSTEKVKYDIYNYGNFYSPSK